MKLTTCPACSQHVRLVEIVADLRVGPHDPQPVAFDALLNRQLALFGTVRIVDLVHDRAALVDTEPGLYQLHAETCTGRPA